MESQPGRPRVARGSCLCGGVRFEVDLPLLAANHCHCSRCQKHSGASGCLQAQARRAHFRLLTGQERIRVYGRGQGAVKAFCGECGSSLFGGQWPEGRNVSIRLGVFDDDPEIAPQLHTFVDDRAPWDEIHDDLPQYGGAWSRAREPAPKE